MNHDPLPRPSTAVHSTLQVDGFNVLFRRAGDPSRPAFVLLHGLPSSSHRYRDPIRLLAEPFDDTGPDCVGFGHSDAPAADRLECGSARQDKVVERLRVQLGVERHHLYMHDFGGPVGLCLAAKHP